MVFLTDEGAGRRLRRPRPVRPVRGPDRAVPAPDVQDDPAAVQGTDRLRRARSRATTSPSGAGSGGGSTRATRRPRSGSGSSRRSRPPPRCRSRPRRSRRPRNGRRGPGQAGGKSTTTEAARQAHDEIVALTDAFCRDHLDDEYGALCRKLAGVLARKRPSPLTRGKPESWASGIVRVVGWVNFLDDPSQPHHMKMTDIDEGFGRLGGHRIGQVEGDPEPAQDPPASTPNGRCPAGWTTTRWSG